MQTLQPSPSRVNLPSNPVDQSLISQRGTPLYAYTVEGEIITCPGIHIEIRRLQWDVSPYTAIRTSVCHLYMALSRSSQDKQHLISDDFGKVEVGTCIFIPSNHEFLVESSAIDGRLLCCTFDLDALQSHIDPSFGRLDLVECMNIPSPRIRNGMALLAEETLTPGFAKELLVESTVTSLIIELARYSHGVRTKAEGGSKLSLRQLRLIEDRVEGAAGSLPSALELASELGLSHRHLARMFKNTTGHTLSEYVTEVRVNQAKQLLANHKILIKTVAYTCGFQSQEAFAKAFRKATGWAPQQYRKVVLN